MSMNRLRNVAVRMRPLAQPPSEEAGLPFEESHVRAEAIQPRRPVVEQEVRTSRRQIWDLEADEVADAPRREPMAEPRTTPAEQAELTPPLILSDPVVPNAPGPVRAKTRMLGFHTQAPGSNLFDEEQTANASPQFPAGFLVVVDGPGRGAFFAVSTRVSSIGRAPDQDISLDFGDESISREGHASVVYDDEQNRFFLGQGNKANVVRRNDAPVLMTEELSHNDTIRIGKTSLRFHAFCGADFTWSDAEPKSQSGRIDG